MKESEYELVRFQRNLEIALYAINLPEYLDPGQEDRLKQARRILSRLREDLRDQIDIKVFESE